MCVVWGGGVRACMRVPHSGLCVGVDRQAGRQAGKERIFLCMDVCCVLARC